MRKVNLGGHFPKQAVECMLKYSYGLGVSPLPRSGELRRKGH